MYIQSYRLRPPSRLILVASLVYLMLALLAGLEIWHILHRTMVIVLYILLALTLFRQLALLILAMRERPPAKSLINSEPPLVSILLPAYNEAAVIQASLQSLMELRYPHLEIIVIDDGSQDDTAERARNVAMESTVPVRVISQANKGKAGALNTGFIHASGAYVLVVDDLAEAIARANESPYGLSAGILTHDLQKGMQAARQKILF